MRRADLAVEDPGFVILTADVRDGFGESANLTLLIQVQLLSSPAIGRIIADDVAVAGVPFPIRIEWLTETPEDRIGSGVILIPHSFRTGTSDETRVANFGRADVQDLPDGRGTFWEGEISFAERGAVSLAAVGAPFGKSVRTLGVVPSFAAAVTLTVLPSVAGDLHSGIACAEGEGTDFAHTWQVSLVQDEASVGGTISFHACPGRGRVQYIVRGMIQDPEAETLTLLGSRNIALGPLGAASPTTQVFLIRLKEEFGFEGEPGPNLDPVHDLEVAIASVGNGQALVGRPVTITAVVTNRGEDAASEVEVVVSVRGAAIFSGGVNCRESFEGAFCSLGDLPEGESREVSVTFTPQIPGAMHPTFSVGAAGSDFVTANNSASGEVEAVLPG